jgi:hypothetical protein
MCPHTVPVKNQNIISQKIVLFIITVVRSSNLRYNRLWKEHVDRMSSDTIPKILEYQPKGKTSFKRSLK